MFNGAFPLHYLGLSTLLCSLSVAPAVSRISSQIHMSTLIDFISAPRLHYPPASIMMTIIYQYMYISSLMDFTS